MTTKRQRGLSLIELMVSLTIGLILMVAIISTYIGSSSASRVSEAQSRMDEDGQAALSILAQQLRMAGSNPLRATYISAQPYNPAFSATTTAATGTYIVRGCDATFDNITTAADIADLTCTGAASHNSIAISYEADSDNTGSTTAGTAFDCVGQTIPTTTATLVVSNGTSTTTQVVSYAVADNRYYIGTSNVITVPSLYCKGKGGATQPLVENIEDMKIVYGTALPDATSTLGNYPPAAQVLGGSTIMRTVAGYLTATQMENDALLTPLPNSPARWERAVSVRICVLVRSEQPIANEVESARYVKCDGTLESNPPDLRLRKAYSTTVVMRNRMPPQ